MGGGGARITASTQPCFLQQHYWSFLTCQNPEGFVILTAVGHASDSRVEGFRVHVRTAAGPTAEVGSGVVAATSSFAHARTTRDGHLTPAFP